MAPASPEASRTARRAVALLATLTVLATVGFANDFLVMAEEARPLTPAYRLAEGDEGYFVAAYLPGWGHLFGTWSARPHQAPERAWVVDLQDAERILDGEAPAAPYAAWDLSADAAWGSGALAFTVPDRCISCGPLLLVWTKGQVPAGRDLADLPGHEWNPPFEAPVGPLVFAGRVVDAGLHARAPWWQGAILASAAATLAAALAWAFLARRERDRRPALPFDPARPTPTEEMLRLVRLSELYVATISRYFLVSAVVILLSGALVMHLALPPVLAALRAQVPAFRETLPGAIFILAVPFAVLVAALFWAVEYRRVRRELTRWRDLSRRFEEDAERILAA